MRRLAVSLLLMILAAGCSANRGPVAAAQVPVPVPALGAQAALADRTTTAGVVAGAGITVNGVGRITGRPDTLRATVGVGVTRPTVQEALDAAAEAADRVLGALGDAGVAEDDVQTREFSVFPQYGGANGDVITGYQVSNLVEAVLRDLDEAGAVLDAVTEAGGNDALVQGVTYALEDNAALLAEARAAAVADARAKAAEYATAAGVGLGALTGLSEVTAALPQSQQFDVPAAEAADAGAARVPLAAGSQEVAVTITATWAVN